MKRSRSPQPRAMKTAVISGQGDQELDDPGRVAAGRRVGSEGRVRRRGLLLGERHGSSNATGRHPAPGGGPAIARALARASASAASTASTSSTWSSTHPAMVSATTSAMPDQTSRPVQEGLHRDLVGGAEPGRGRAAAAAGLVGQVDAAEDGAVGRLEGQGLGPRPVESAEGRRGTVGPAEGVADGEAHVGLGQLGQRRPVAQLHHGVDDRLGVHHDLDPVVVDAEELVGLNDLEALVHQRRRVDGDLRPHGPRRVGQRVGHRDRAEPLGRPAPERTARGGEEQPGHVGRALQRGQALVQRAVLGVDRDDLGPGRAAGLLHDGRAGDQRLLVGQRQPLARPRAPPS